MMALSVAALLLALAALGLQVRNKRQQSLSRRHAQNRQVLGESDHRFVIIRVSVTDHRDKVGQSRSPLGKFAHGPRVDTSTLGRQIAQALQQARRDGRIR